MGIRWPVIAASGVEVSAVLVELDPDLASAARSSAAELGLAGIDVRTVPGLTGEDLEPGCAGVRAQALRRDGTLEDDFVLSATERALHVRNAPSPAATSALALARLIVDRVDEAHGA